MKDDQIKQLQFQIELLEGALELIAEARARGKSIDYAVGVAESALKRQRAAA